MFRTGSHQSDVEQGPQGESGMFTSFLRSADCHVVKKGSPKGPK